MISKNSISFQIWLAVSILGIQLFGNFGCVNKFWGKKLKGRKTTWKNRAFGGWVGLRMDGHFGASHGRGKDEESRLTHPRWALLGCLRKNVQLDGILGSMSYFTYLFSWGIHWGYNLLILTFYWLPGTPKYFWIKNLVDIAKKLVNWVIIAINCQKGMMMIPYKSNQLQRMVMEPQYYYQHLSFGSILERPTIVRGPKASCRGSIQGVFSEVREQPPDCVLLPQFVRSLDWFGWIICDFNNSGRPSNSSPRVSGALP